MKQHTTDHLLTLGMALTTDKKSMERRVRGVFARKKSAKGALVLAGVLALALGFGAFTTACQPGRATVSDSNALLASNGDALASGGNVLASGGNALASGGNATASSQEFTKEAAMQQLEQTLDRARKFPVPRMEDIVFTERGTWEIQKNLDAAQLRTAAEQFLKIANEIFAKTYTTDDLKATYYIDKTGHRADVWRFDSTDGKLSGALNAETLTFLSADCINEPSDRLHESMLSAQARGETKQYWNIIDVSDATSRIAALFGGTAIDPEIRGGGGGRDDATNGWMLNEEVLFALGDGTYCSINVFGDENLTPTTVCVFPDKDCAEEGVFWRADLERVEEIVSLLFPQDFREGKPGAGDMAREDAIAFYDKLLEAAGYIGLVPNEAPAEPKSTFYMDYSGARENYWLIEGNGVSLELTSKTGRMLSLTANGTLGSKLGLGDIPYEKMGEQEYTDATQKLFVALFGKDAVKGVEENAVYDYHYCTVDPIMADGTQYEIMYQDGLIVEVSSFYKIDPNTWVSVPDWLQEWTSIDEKTGEISITGFENGTWKIVPNWIADWVYRNNETGEIFAMEW